MKYFRENEILSEEPKAGWVLGDVPQTQHIHWTVTSIIYAQNSELVTLPSPAPLS